MRNGTPVLKDLWYFAAPARSLKPGGTLALTICGEPILLGRASDGTVFALRDLCPHRGMPLSHGRFDGREVECCYHGWRFDTAGVCRAIPSLAETARLDCTRITVAAYPCREQQGVVWIFLGDLPEGERPPVPEVPDIGDRAPNLAYSVPLPVNADHGIVGLIDPAHGPFVHRSWWWRSGKAFRQKAKAFAPSHLGFTMVRHTPSSNSPAYRLLGGKGAVDTEISFQLPGVRIELIRLGRHRFCGMTAVTPVSETESLFHHVIYWTSWRIGLGKPFLAFFMKRFLDQDGVAFAKQAEGLAHDPQLMLVEDADMQARWYFQAKAEYAAARAEGRPFRNPATERVLHWRS